MEKEVKKKEVCAERQAQPASTMNRERQHRERFRLCSDNEASELRDVGDGANVDPLSTKYLYRDQKWSQYLTLTRFHPPCKDFRGSSRPKILYRMMPSLTFLLVCFGHTLL